MTNECSIPSKALPASDSELVTRFSLADRRFAPCFFICLLTLYLAAYLISFLCSPTGRFPSLDAAEHLKIAQQIATGSLPSEPFYRAMLYPGVLSLFLRLGVTMDGLPIAAGVLGCAVHFGSMWFIFQMARRAWDNSRAGWIAALLFGFNPVAIYFAVQPLDTTFALFLFLGGLNLMWCRYPTTAHNRRHFLLFGIGVSLWSLATLARPHYAIVLAGLPVVLIVMLWRVPKILAAVLVTAGLSMGMCLASVGLLQKARCGEFRIMPTQGGYSLWVGNRPGANGRYYEQQIALPPGAMENGENPARVESEFLYRQETGTSGQISQDQMSHYWRSKAVSAIRNQPMKWIGLMARKTYYLFNDFEQYNNQTFAVQKELSPLLRWNPLGWGATFVLCCVGMAAAFWAGRSYSGAAPAILVAAFYAAGVVLFFVSDRFRLPLLPFLCVGAGAWGCAAKEWSGMFVKRAVSVGAVGGIAALLTFSRAWGVYDLSPAVEDYVSLSIAAGKAGDDHEGLRWALKALEQKPDHPSALARAVTSFYNLKLQGIEVEREFPGESWQRQLERIARIPQPASGVRLIEGIALWKMGQSAKAEEVLRTLAGSSNVKIGDDALGVLMFTRLAKAEDIIRAKSRINEATSFYLLTGLARQEDGTKSIPEALRPVIAQSQPLVANIFPQD